MGKLMTTRKKNIIVIGIAILIVAISSVGALYALRLLKPNTSTDTQESGSTTELRQSGIEKIEQGKTEEGTKDLEAALEQAKEEGNAQAATEIEQQIDFAEHEPAKVPDTPIAPNPNQVIAPTTNQDSSIDPIAP